MPEPQGAGPETVRLSLNLPAETNTVLRDTAQRRGISVTEGVRRAVAVWKFLEDEERGIPRGTIGTVQVSESSDECGPHIWLTVMESMPDEESPHGTLEVDAAISRGDDGRLCARLTAGNAVQVAERLLFLVRYHYRSEDNC